MHFVRMAKEQKCDTVKNTKSNKGTNMQISPIFYWNSYYPEQQNIEKEGDLSIEKLSDN